MQAKASAAGYQHGFVVKRVVWLRDADIRPGRSGIVLRRTLHGECFVWALVVEFLNKGIELALLLQDVGARRASGFFLQSQMHAFVPAVGLR